MGGVQIFVLSVYHYVLYMYQYTPNLPSHSTLKQLPSWCIITHYKYHQQNCQILQNLSELYSFNAFLRMHKIFMYKFAIIRFLNKVCKIFKFGGKMFQFLSCLTWKLPRTSLVQDAATRWQHTIKFRLVHVKHKRVLYVYHHIFQKKGFLDTWTTIYHY